MNPWANKNDLIVGVFFGRWRAGRSDSEAVGGEAVDVRGAHYKWCGGRVVVGRVGVVVGVGALLEWWDGGVGLLLMVAIRGEKVYYMEGGKPRSSKKKEGSGLIFMMLFAVDLCFPCKSNLNSPYTFSRELEQLSSDDLEEIEMVSSMGDGHDDNKAREQKVRDQLKQTLEKFLNSSKSLNNILESQVIDKFKTGLGYSAAAAASPAVESFVNLTDMYGSDKGYHSVPPPLIGNFIPRKPDLTFVDEIVVSENLDFTTVVTPSNAKTVENKGVSNIVESNAVRMNNTSAPIIEDWNSDDESEIDYTFRPNTEKIESVKTVRETDAPKQSKQHPRGNQRNWNNLMSQRLGSNPQQKEYKEKGVIDSGCSRNMIGNKCYLDEYEDYDGGFVSFGDGKGRISGKGKIKTRLLDFDDVYICKELKYNLFSVSKICDKKNNVLFTNTECLFLSSNFKLLDKSQVLLRVPRKENIYNVDLKSVVPT
ncbi:hypothetical protein Tco_0410401 [Tanacetum coccineum]